MPSGKLIVLTGPSGVGKGTLVRALLVRHPQLYLSVSATTRLPRSGEIDSKDYYFVSRSQFEEMVQAGQLLEWAQYAGNYYGTPRSKVEAAIKEGKTVLLEIEIIGAKVIKQAFRDALRIFILPPSWEELERRLKNRGQDSEAAIRRRLERAKEELAESNQFERQIVNDDLQQALQQLEAIIFAELLQ